MTNDQRPTTNTHLAHVNGGWGLDAHGRIVRGTIVDRVRRLLRPLWGPVWCEPGRGDAPWPRQTDAIAVIVEDRIRYVLAPLVAGREIASLAVTVETDSATPGSRARARIAFVDAMRRPHQLSEFVRLP